MSPDWDERRAMKKVLILGIGNILQSDDGVGVHIANAIMESGIDLPEEVEVADGGTAGFDLIPLMQEKDRVVIIDALNTDDYPGSVYRFSAQHIRCSSNRISLHDVGLADVIHVLDLMGKRPEIEIVGIVPADITTTAIRLSEQVEKAVPKAVKVVLDTALHTA